MQTKTPIFPQRKKAFTLVELIIVITILAILATIAFVSFQGYSAQSRDSNRVATVKNIENGVNIFITKTGKVPEPDDVIGSGKLTSGGPVLNIVGKVGAGISRSINLNETPLDPRAQEQYWYGVDTLRRYFQVGLTLESETAFAPGILPSYAGNILEAKVQGNYEYPLKLENIVYSLPSLLFLGSGGVLNNQTEFVVDEGNNVPYTFGGEKSGTQSVSEVLKIITGTGNLSLTGVSLPTMTMSDYKASTGTEIPSAFSGMAQLLGITDKNKLGVVVYGKEFVGVGVSRTSESTTHNEMLITQTECDSAGWFWVDSSHDVFIGTTQGSGFCISPIFGDWGDTSDGTDGISWNGWGNNSTSYFNGWNAIDVVDSGHHPTAIPYGQTRILDSKTSYDCKPLGTVTSNSDNTDTLIGRMKWLTSTGNTYLQAQSIAWIVEIGTDIPLSATGGHAIPALYIADCIDGVKNIGTNLTYNGTGGTVNEITYTQYSTDRIRNDDSDAYPGCDIDFTHDPDLDCVIYQNRQKYLIAWTQIQGSHLPSAMSYIADGFATANDGDGDYLIGNDRGEYQVACELGIFGTVTRVGNQYIGSYDDIYNEWIFTSSIGSVLGENWGHVARKIGANGCGNQITGHTGGRYGNTAARFVIRP